VTPRGAAWLFGTLAAGLALAPAPAAASASPTGPAAAGAAPGTAPIFTEEAAARGLDFVHFNGMSGELYFLETMGSGVALFDYDGDGDLDAYFLQGHMLGPGKTVADSPVPPQHPLPLSDRLYRNDLTVLPDGTREARFVDVTEASGLAAIATGYGMGVAAGDYDGDGWVDLYLANYGANQLLRNQGDGTFADVTSATGTDDRRWSAAATFVDYDLDGDLDLYVANYVDFTFANHHDCFTASGAIDYCGPLNYDAPQPDRLLRNDGPAADGTVRFTDVSAAAGILEARGNGLGAVAADFDGDGWPDLYVANDQVPNFLWTNLHDGTFREDGLLAGCAVNREGNAEASMGVVAEDVDGDGDEDLFMAHLREETNTLFLNDGTGLFQDLTVQSGLGPASFSYTTFGAGFLDYDNDGDLDLLVGSGAVTLIDELRQKGDPYPVHQPNQLFRNLGGLRFEDISDRAGPAFALSEVTRGIAFGDVDDDGDTDALLMNNSGPARLLVDRVGQDRHWLGLRVLHGDDDALGARAEIRAEGVGTLWRRVRTDGSYASVNDPRILAGLGTATKVDTARVHWRGTVRTWRGLPADRLLTVYVDDTPGAAP